MGVTERREEKEEQQRGSAGSNPDTDEALIRLHRVSKLYAMGEARVAALDEVDLTVERGELVAITGPSGSGKSTLMNIIGCLDVPTSGRYFLGGRDVSRLGERDLAAVRNREIGFVFQSFHLLARSTALENVELPLVYSGIPRPERRARAIEALESVHMEDRASHRPSELSGGQSQRVAIARALVTRPSLLLADEPTGNLDTATTVEILELFETLHAQGNTLLLVTHEEEIAARAARRVLIRDGKVVGDERGGREGEARIA